MGQERLNCQENNRHVTLKSENEKKVVFAYFPSLLTHRPDNFITDYSIFQTRRCKDQFVLRKFSKFVGRRWL